MRYVDFVDNDGTPLVEHVPMDRLRLPPPPAPSGWVPGLGEPVEGFWNDCWWEGCVREFHVYKGILFQCVACRHMHARAAHTHTHGWIACMRGERHILTLFCFALSLAFSLRYDRWAANWLWLPLRCCRPRPPFWLYYPMRPAEEGEGCEILNRACSQGSAHV